MWGSVVGVHRHGLLLGCFLVPLVFGGEGVLEAGVGGGVGEALSLTFCLCPRRLLFLLRVPGGRVLGEPGLPASASASLSSSVCPVAVPWEIMS